MAGAADDSQLMTQYAAGDAAAFEELYARHKGSLYRYFARQCGSTEVADELFQDVWLRIIKARERYEPKARFTTYMYQIAHHCLIEHFRKSGRALTSASDTGEFKALNVPPDPAALATDPAFASARWSLVDWESSAGVSSDGLESALSDAERAQRLRSALDTLPIEQREAFLLHEEAEMGLADIAKVTGANADAIKGRLRHAVRKLRAALGDLTPARAGGSLS